MCRARIFWPLYHEINTLFSGNCGAKDLLMTPRILDSIVLMSCGFDGCFDLIRIAVVSKTVAIGLSPAALIVSPDSVGGFHKQINLANLSWK